MPDVVHLRFRDATAGDVAVIAALQNAAADALTSRFGAGHWSSLVTERAAAISRRHARIRLGISGKRVLTVVRLATKKPWAIDVYMCPRCGRVELFVDGVGEEFRQH